nr:Crp/Fnr family transcriptional regulator [uncultured Pedobacter sp.]
MKKRKLIVLTDEMILLWKQSTIDYLKTLSVKPLNKLELTLMLPGYLRPQFKLKGSILLEPGMLINEAWYLRKGLAILYTIEPKTGLMSIYYIWEANSIIVLHDAFVEQVLNQEFYIELIEDCELVGISNLTMSEIYEEERVVHVLIQKILNLQTERMMMQLEILMLPKTERPDAFTAMFPGLRGRLSNGEVCGFTGIKLSTLGYTRSGK